MMIGNNYDMNIKDRYSNAMATLKTCLISMIYQRLMIELLNTHKKCTGQQGTLSVLIHIIIYTTPFQIRQSVISQEKLVSVLEASHRSGDVCRNRYNNEFPILIRVIGPWIQVILGCRVFLPSSFPHYWQN